MAAKCFQLLGDFLRKDTDDFLASDGKSFRGIEREYRIRRKEEEACLALVRDGLLSSLADLFIKMRSYLAACMHAMRVVPCFFDAPRSFVADEKGSKKMREVACYALLALPKLFLAKQKEPLLLSSTCSEDTIRCVSIVVRQSLVSDPLWTTDTSIIPWFVHCVRHDIGVIETAIVASDFLGVVVQTHANSTDAEVTQHIVAAGKLLIEVGRSKHNISSTIVLFLSLSGPLLFICTYIFNLSSVFFKLFRRC